MRKCYLYILHKMINHCDAENNSDIDSFPSQSWQKVKLVFFKGAEFRTRKSSLPVNLLHLNLELPNYFLSKLIRGGDCQNSYLRPELIRFTERSNVDLQKRVE